MHISLSHGLWHLDPNEALICKPYTLLVVSVERGGGVDGGATLDRELGATVG